MIEKYTSTCTCLSYIEIYQMRCLYGLNVQVLHWPDETHLKLSANKYWLKIFNDLIFWQRSLTSSHLPMHHFYPYCKCAFSLAICCAVCINLVHIYNFLSKKYSRDSKVAYWNFSGSTNRIFWDLCGKTSNLILAPSSLPQILSTPTFQNDSCHVFQTYVKINHSSRGVFHHVY